MDNKNKLMWSVGVVVVVLVVVVWWGFSIGDEEMVKVDEGDQNNIIEQIGGVVGEIPEGTKLVNQGEEVEGVISPIHVSNLGESQARFYKIEIADNKIDSKRLVSRVGDLVSIEVVAVDGDYDLTIPFFGMKQVVKKGETKKLEFQSNTVGTFVYYCEVCGGEEGEVVVLPDNEEE